MNATQHVVLATLVAFILFALGGPDGTTRVTNSIRRLEGQKPQPRPEKSDPTLSVQSATGWAVMFIFLIILADIPFTQDLGIGFAWLIAFVVLLLYGQDAFKNITKVVTPPSGGSAGKKKAGG